MKKIIRDYTYFTETLNDLQVLSKNATSEFRRAVYESTNTDLEELLTSNVNEPSEVYVEPKDSDDKQFKKLFRTLVLKCHPDKLNMTDNILVLKKCYEDLIIANKTYNWGLLLAVANIMNSELPELSGSQVQNITNKIVDIKKNIESVETSMAYTWYNMDPNDQKEYLVKCVAFLQKN